MTTQTLNALTLQTVENCRLAATDAVKAYRLGSHRLLGAVDGALENRVYPRTAKLAPRATDRLNEVRGNVSELVAKGIDQVADFSGKAIESSSSVATTQLTRLADFAATIEQPVIQNGLQTVSRLSLPGAKVALLVSSKVAEGADGLVRVAGGKPVQRAVRKAAAGTKRVVRRAKAAVAVQAKQPVRKRAAAAKPAVKAVTRRKAAKTAVSSAE